VIAEIVEDLQMPWGKDELDTVFDRLRFGLRDNLLVCWIWLPRVLGPAEDVIPASSEWILA
jgi:hypothetical protein